MCRHGQGIKSIHLLYKDAKDDVGSYSELICYDCWALEEGSPTPEGFLQAQKSASKWMYISFWDPEPFVILTRGSFLMGTYVDAGKARAILARAFKSQHQAAICLVMLRRSSARRSIVSLWEF